MSVRSFEKNAVRATVLAFFIFAYGANTVSYVATSGFAPATLDLALFLLPPLAVGIATGSMLSKRLSEALFRKILLFVLLSTIATLLSSLY